MPITGPNSSVDNRESIHFSCPHCGASNLVWVSSSDQGYGHDGFCQKCLKHIRVITWYGKITEIEK